MLDTFAGCRMQLGVSQGGILQFLPEIKVGLELILQKQVWVLSDHIFVLVCGLGCEHVFAC